MQTNLIPFPKEVADYRMRCRGVMLQSANCTPWEMNALATMIRELPDAVVADLEFVVAFAPNDLLIGIRDWPDTRGVGKAVALAVANFFGCSFVDILVEGHDERRQIKVQSDGRKSWVVQ
jgi:hypothetical protein